MEDEKPLGYSFYYMKAPFMGANMFSLGIYDARFVGFSTMGTVYLYEDKIVLKWGFIRKNEKVIPFEKIKSFRIKNFDFTINKIECISEINFVENAKEVKVETCPGGNFALSPIRDITEALKQAIPDKEVK